MEDYNANYGGGYGGDGNNEVVDNAEKAMNIFERLNHYIEKHGIKNTIITAMVTFLVGFLVYCFINPKPIMERIDKIRAENVAKQVEERIKVDPAIRADLITLRETLNADRAFIFEMHNGNTNISGLHFIYVDMTYDEPTKDYEKVMMEYLNMRTSNYPWIGEICKRHYWFGKIADFEEWDPEIYFRLMKEGIKYVGLIMIDDNSAPNGILGISYYTDEGIPQYDDIRRMMNKYAIIIAPQISVKKK